MLCPDCQQDNPEGAAECGTCFAKLPAPLERTRLPPSSAEEALATIQRFRWVLVCGRSHHDTVADWVPSFCDVGGEYFCGHLLGAILYLTAAYLLPQNKSRTIACLLLANELVLSGLAIGALMGLLNKELSTGMLWRPILLWVANRMVIATFAYHRAVASKVHWRNVAKVSGMVILLVISSGGVPVAILEGAAEVMPNLTASSKAGLSCVGHVVALFTVGVGLWILPMWFPLMESMGMDSKSTYVPR